VDEEWIPGSPRVCVKPQEGAATWQLEYAGQTFAFASIYDLLQSLPK
jgi:hypothetical protein